MLEYVKISFARPLCLLAFGALVSTTLSASLSSGAHAMQSTDSERMIIGLRAPAPTAPAALDDSVVELDLSSSAGLSDSSPGVEETRLDADFINRLQLGTTLQFTPPRARFTKRTEVLTLKVETRRILGNERVAVVLRDVDGGEAHAQFVLRNGAVAAALHTGDGAWWRLSEAPGFAMLVEPMTSDDLPLCGGASQDPQGGPAADLPDPANLILESTSGGLAGDGPQLGPLCSGGCSSTTIDLAIFYTQNTVLGTGSPLIVEALCELGVLQANTGFENSASTTRVRIVYLGQVDYDDSVESGHLDHLVNPDDDYMDEVQDIMQAASADVASLIVEFDEGWCGVAYLFDPTRAQYHVNARFCLGGFVLAHELGHNLGACHADGDGGGCDNGGAFPFSNGWRFNGNSGNQYRTIMAYSPGTRIPHYSNPYVLYQGQPTGEQIEEDFEGVFQGADNILTMNIVTPMAAEWACSSASTSTVKILPSNPVELDLFGTVTAIDNGQPIIGSYLSDEGDENTGATYIYRTSDPSLDGFCAPNPYTGVTPETCWIQDGKAPILESRPIDGMGKSISAHNGLLVSGAPFRDRYDLEEGADEDDDPVLQEARAGAVFLHRSDMDTGWCLEQELYSEEPTDEFRFGNTVATDGVTVAVTSERFEAVGGSTEYNGSVELFTYDPSFDNGVDENDVPLPSGSWTFDQRLEKEIGLGSQYIGYGDVLALDDDHLAVGAPMSSSSRGQVVMYRRVAGEWLSLELLTATSSAADTLFGASISINDGRMIIGAPGANDGDGLIFVYEFRDIDNAWEEVWTSGPLLGDDGASFGTSVAIDGDHLVIGAPLSDISEVVDSGAAFLAKNVDDAWFIVDQLYAFDGETSDQYGMSVALEGDLVLVGAGYDNDNGIQSGSAYVYPFAPLFDCNLNGYGDEYEIEQGISQDTDGNGVPDPCDCAGDINFDGIVDGGDLTLLLNNWGFSGPAVVGDVNRDGTVDGADITAVLVFWGVCIF